MNDHIEHYKGHEIRIFVFRPIGIESFRGKYEIRAIGNPNGDPLVGIVAGAFAIERDAEEGALRAAKQAIDNERSTTV